MRNRIVAVGIQQCTVLRLFLSKCLPIFAVVVLTMWSHSLLGNEPWPESWASLNSWNSRWDFTNGEVWCWFSTWEPVLHFNQKILPTPWPYLQCFPLEFLCLWSRLVQTFGGHVFGCWINVHIEGSQISKNYRFSQVNKKPNISRNCVALSEMFLVFSIRTC